MKNKVIALFCFILIPFTLAAKGTGEQSKASGEKVTLEFWIWRTEDVEFYNNVIATFEKKTSEYQCKTNGCKKHRIQYDSQCFAARRRGT